MKKQEKKTIKCLKNVFIRKNRKHLNYFEIIVKFPKK